MEFFLARQAIYNKSKDVIAYELLYRNSIQNRFDTAVDDSKATYEIMKNIVFVGFEVLTNNKTALINCSEEVLNSDVITILPNESIIIEILETVKANDSVIKRLSELKKKGYIFAIDDVVDFKSIEKFLKFVNYVKIDFMLTTRKSRKILVDKLRNYKVTLLAEKIETEEEYKEALNLGFKLFQGFYFSKPRIIKGKDIAIKSNTILFLMQELSKNDFDINVIENIMKSDVALMYKFMKFINSAKFGFKYQISDIKQAVAIVGQKQLQKWIFLFSFVDLGKDISSEYTNTVIIRARFCELIMEVIDKNKKSEAFIVGIFSEIAAIIEDNIKNVICDLPIKIEIKDALLGKDNLLFKILNLALAYEKVDIEKIDMLCDDLRINNKILGELYLLSIKWVKDSIVNK